MSAYSAGEFSFLLISACDGQSTIFKEDSITVDVRSIMVETIIREFVEGRDERAWIELYNEFKSYYYGSDFEPLDERGVEWFKRTPW